MTRYLSIIFVTALLAFSASSCRSHKSTATTSSTASPASVIAPEINQCKNMLGSYDGQWKRLKMPMNVNLTSPKSMSVSGNAIMERGKSILLSFRIFGLEVACLYLTEDSLMAIDKYNKRYVSEALRPLLGGFPVNISNVQDLLLGHPFLLGSDKDISELSSNFDISTFPDSRSWTLIPRSSPKGIEYGFSFDDLTRLGAIIIKCGDHTPVTVTYTTPVLTQAAGPISPSVTVEAESGKTQIEASIDWNIRKAQWDSDVTLRSVTPGKNYERIPAARLLKMLSSF